MSRKTWLLGAPVLVGVFLWNPSPMLILLVVLAAPHVWQALKGMGAEHDAYYQLPFAKRFEYGFLYIGLLVFLSIMMH